MREHIGLYRGKRICNGKWVEGYLLRYADGTCFICHAGYRLNRYKVDPDTIGECTGLKDKNGKLIFEGDILHSSCGECLDCKVIFNDYCASFQLELFDGYCADFWELASLNHMVIIGNIHDNSELLKGGEGE